MVRGKYKCHRLPGFWDWGHFLSFLCDRTKTRTLWRSSRSALSSYWSPADLPLRIIRQSQIYYQVFRSDLKDWSVCIYTERWLKRGWKQDFKVYLHLSIKPFVTLASPSLRLSNYPLLKLRGFWLYKHVMLEKCTGIAGREGMERC